MFSRKLVVAISLVVLVLANLVLLMVAVQNPDTAAVAGRVPLALVAPFQEKLTLATRKVRDLWMHYFLLVSAAKENSRLKKELSRISEQNNRCVETELANARFRNLLLFKNTMPAKMVAAEVVGRDPSPWFQTLTINKGTADQVTNGLPVVVPDGIVGQVIKVGTHYAQVLMLIDKNSSVDAMVQRTRSRGIIRGDTGGQSRFDYVLRKEDVEIGDRVVASGLDGVYPKGHPIGRVSTVKKPSAGIFQDIYVTPYVDFEKLEEIFVVVTVEENSDTVFGR